MTEYINSFDIKNFSFKYAQADAKSNWTLSSINFSVAYGEFITLCGKTGSGKSTLLRHLKPVLAPEGKREGNINFYGRPLKDVSAEEQARRIGYVLQDPENQIVTDKVWHELAFGLENLGIDTETIRIRVAEMATFFGIFPWINRETAELSGGQKQLLNLASVMAMNPDILILDEPTSQLDPVASEEFIDTLIRINEEIGTTVIISEHDLNKVMPASDRVIVLEGGKLIADAEPKEIGNIVSSRDRDFILSMPVPLQIYMNLKDDYGWNDSGPLTVRDGRDWLTNLFKGESLSNVSSEKAGIPKRESVISLRDIRFKYRPEAEDVIKNLNMNIGKGLITTIAGGNGSGKSTLLRIIAGIGRPYKGKVKTEISRIILLPQNPQTLFVEGNVERELVDVLKNMNISSDKVRIKIDEMSELMELDGLMDRHAYDLSGGEQQRVGFAKVLLTDGDVYLLDEPTTGLDGANKKILGEIIRKLSLDGKTIVIVTHDLEFAAQYSDICMLLFDGQIMSEGTPGRFFSDNSFYTTSGNRMSRHIFDKAVTPDDVTDLCRENLEK